MTADQPIDGQRFIDARGLSPVQILLLVLCFLVVAVDGFVVTVFAFPVSKGVNMRLSLRNCVAELARLLWRRRRGPTPPKPGTLRRAGSTGRSGPSRGHAMLNGGTANEGLTAFQLQVWALLPETDVLEEERG